MSLQAECMILLQCPPSACLQLLGTGALDCSVETCYVSTHIFHNLILHNTQRLSFGHLHFPAVLIKSARGDSANQLRVSQNTTASLHAPSSWFSAPRPSAVFYAKVPLYTKGTSDGIKTLLYWLHMQ